MLGLIRVKRGFTLIELMVVMAVLGVLVTIVVAAINPTKIIKQSQDTKARTELSQVKAAMQLYYNDNKSYPADPNFLVSTYIKKLPNNISCCNGGGQDYRATATINYVVGADIESSQRCIGSGQTPNVGGYFYICPD